MHKNRAFVFNSRFIIFYVLLYIIQDVTKDVKLRTTTGIPFKTSVLSYSNYYPFGMQYPDIDASTTQNATYQSAEYRYGYNGKEKDGEVKGEGNSYDYGARIYDPRIGKFLSMDPLSQKYPHVSPYMFAANSVIQMTDENGEYPLYKHFVITYKALVSSGVDKQTAIDIAHGASVYADNPGKLTYKNAPIWEFNWNGMVKHGFKESYLKYNTQRYGDYETTKNSQSDELIAGGVSLHAMRTYWEDISAGEAIDRAIYGGKYKELDGSEVQIEGAQNIINRYRGRGFNNLTMKEKLEVGLALHTIQDAQVHQGGIWVDEHKKEAELMGVESQHPNIVCTTGHNQSGAVTETQKAINAINNGTEYKFELHNIKLHDDKKKP